MGNSTGSMNGGFGNGPAFGSLGEGGLTHVGQISRGTGNGTLARGLSGPCQTHMNDGRSNPLDFGVVQAVNRHTASSIMVNAPRMWASANRSGCYAPSGTEVSFDQRPFIHAEYPGIGSSGANSSGATQTLQQAYATFGAS